MKNTIAFILSVLLICSCSTVVFAEEEKYGTAGELYSAWHNHLPDYICGVWSTDGGSSNLTFGIQNNEAGEAGKQEILKLIEDDSTVTFVYQVYSRNYLYQVFQDLHKYFNMDLGLIILGLSDTDNCVELEFLDTGKNNAYIQGVIEGIIWDYGDAVKIEYIDESQIPVADVPETEVNQPTEPISPAEPTTPEETTAPIELTLPAETATPIEPATPSEPAQPIEPNPKTGSFPLLLAGPVIVVLIDVMVLIAMRRKRADYESE